MRRLRDPAPRSVSVTVVYHFDRRLRVWGTESPEYPGAYGQGRTRATAKKDLIGAIRDLILAGETWSGQTIEIKRERVRL